jgi:hypothetical protein
MTKKGFVSCILTLGLAFHAWSCKETPVEPVKKTLIVSENPVPVAAGWYKNITVTGTSIGHIVESIGDPTVIGVLITPGSPQLPNSDISILGKKLGSTTMTIRDSSGTVNVVVTVNVVPITSNPTRVDVAMGKSKEVIIQGSGPFNVDVYPDPAIATLVHTPSSIAVIGVAQGNTEFVMMDLATPPNKTTIQVRVTK